MSKTSKKLISMICVIVSLFTMSICVSAEDMVDVCASNYDDEISLCWDNVNLTSITLDFTDNGKIEAKIRIYGTTGTKYKNGTIKIQRYTGTSWMTVKTWSNQAGSSSVFSFSNTTLTALRNAKYKLSIEITAYNGSSSEVISLSKTSTNS